MSIIKCPRCDINFIREEEQFCSICKREMKGDAPKEEPVEMCIECGEHPAAAGEELCSYCLADRAAADESIVEDTESESMMSSDIDDIEIVPMPQEDIPEDEREEIHKELGFDDPEDEDEEAEDEENY